MTDCKGVDESQPADVGLGLERSSDEPASGSEDANQVMPATDGLKRQAPTTHCHGCGRTNSASWHRGPAGPKTLCNTCYRKQVKARNDPKSPLAELVHDDKTDDVETSDAAAREDSSASTVTLHGDEQKENLTKEVGEKALRRKKDLSPLKETFAIQQQATTDAASSWTGSPMVKLTKTDYNLVDRSRSSESSATSSDFAQGVENVQSTQTTTTKRKRMTADEKARLLADEFAAASGSRADKKRRRTAAEKTVRFDLGVEIEGLVGGEETVDGAATGNAAQVDAFASNAAASRAQSKVGEGRKNSVQANAIEMALECESPAAPKPKVRGGRTGWTAVNSAPKAAPPAIHDDVDLSSDNIVVARRKSSEPRRSPSAEISSSGRKDTEAFKKTTEAVKESVAVLSDTMDSEDELALPAPFQMKAANAGRSVNDGGRSKYTAASVSSADASKGDEEGKSDYQTLLSAFNLDGKGKSKAGEVTKGNALTVLKATNRGATAPRGGNLKADAGPFGIASGNEGRPKRVVKRKKVFGDVVDLTTVTEDELGN